MKNVLGDAALFFKSVGGKLSGLCATYVDDSLHAGDKAYCNLAKVTEEKFECKPREYDKMQFSGGEIEKWEDGFHTHQMRYISKLQDLIEPS